MLTNVPPILVRMEPSVPTLTETTSVLVTTDLLERTATKVGLFQYFNVINFEGRKTNFTLQISLFRTTSVLLIVQYQTPILADGRIRYRKLNNIT